MKRSVIVLLVAAMAAPVSLLAAEPKIGVVKTDALLQNSPQYAVAQNNINQEFSPRQREIAALDALLKTRSETYNKDAATMTEMQRSAAEKAIRDGTRELQLKQSAAEEDFNARRDEEMGKLQRIISDEISVFAKANGYDIILAGGVAYAGATYDVTNAILESMKKKVNPAAATPAPAAAKPPATTPAKPPAAPAKP